ncbi:MAG: EAL domain-containing protein [Tissierella sp.]|uniref:EAL domain-containing protein n=1 Tax=Tissierella sp. TaxID=41274 RepID=UPI003F99445B
MSFSFNNIFKKIVGEEISKSKLELQNELDNLKENMFHGQKMVGVGSWTYFLEEDEIFYSEEIYNIFECNSDELKKEFENFNRYFHPDDRLEILKNINALFDGKNYDLKYRIITKLGSLKFIHEKTEIIYDENHKAIKIIGVVEDITNSKIIEDDSKLVNDNIDSSKSIEGFGIWKYDVIKKEYSWSEEVYKIHGITPMEFKNDHRNFIKLLHPDDKTKMEKIFEKALNGKSLKTEYRIFKNDGSVKHIITDIEPHFDKDGKVISLLGSVRDVTRRRELKKKIDEKEKEIKRMEVRFENIIKESNDGFEIVDMEGIIRYSSGSVERITGYCPQEMINTSIYKLFEGKALRIIKDMLKHVAEKPDKNVESNVVFKTKKGEKIYLEIYMTNLIYEPSIRGIVVNFRDISEKIETQKQMIHDAHYDKLTDLQNRDYFFERLDRIEEKARKGNQKYALLMMEIRGYKHINYSLNHSVADRLIVKIVDRLKTIFKDKDCISRYSEDSFCIISKEGKSEKDYKDLGKRIIELFSQPFQIDSYELIITVNIGICIFPKAKEDNLPLKNSVKIALIRAKKKGKNIYKLYSEELNIKYLKELTLRNDLAKAIDKGQLEVYYQPVIKLKTNEIIGAEALIRWNHPEWGLVPPGEFIRIAEETELIINIGKWVLKEVCKSYKKWIDKGLSNMKIGVNFSPIQFFEMNFVDNIKAIIEGFKLNPDFLMVEITESVLLKNKKKVLRDIKALQDMGIEIALDDFGTGFSSLSYLSSLNIDVLKIDKSFIDGLPLNITNSSITRATIKLAKELKIKVVAEGIENWDQLSYLRTLNCKMGQGYIYSKAQPLEKFEEFLHKKKCKPLAYSKFTRPEKDRRKFFRIDFFSFLESNLTILKIGGKTLDVGNTKVLIKNIGPGGLCFISNVRFPIEADIILEFMMNLIDQEIKVSGNPVWKEKIEGGLYEHGVEFRVDENERESLIKILNELQIKMRNDILFDQGDFISDSHIKYFK